MNFNWRSYLTLAEYMYNNIDKFPESEKEAVYRSVISRAYYAVFCMARDYINNNDKQNLDGRSGGEHQKVQIYFINHPNKARQKVGRQLKKLHWERIRADYRNDLDELPINKASKAIAQANKIVSGLENLGLKSNK